MSINNIPKHLLRNLRNYPRDILFSFETIVNPMNIDIPVDYAGYGLDLIVTTALAVANTVLFIDKTWTITVPAGHTFSFDNILFWRLEIISVGSCNIYGAGITKKLMGVNV